MKNWMKRLTALLLAMAMSISLLSANVWAAEEPTDGSVSAQSSEEAAPEEEAPAEESAPTEEEAAPEEKPPAEEPAPTEEEPPAEESAPTEEEAPAEESTPTGEKTSLTPQGTVASGTCGENVTWTLDDAGTLTISGTGEVNEHPWLSTDWEGGFVDPNETIKSVVLSEGITSIGEDSFYWCVNLSRVSLPSSMKKIGDVAFEDCSNLTSVTIPDQVTDIGSGAFSGCTKLSHITIPNRVKYISSGTFANCTSLASVTIPDGVKEIQLDAFNGCTSLSNITIPKSLTNVGEDAFKDTLWLKKQQGLIVVNGKLLCYQGKFEKVVIPSGVTIIGEDAFSDEDYASQIIQLTIPDGVTRIERCAFDGCWNLRRITVPKSVTHIGWGAFGFYYAGGNSIIPIKMTIYGYKGSAAEKYVKKTIKDSKEYHIRNGYGCDGFDLTFVALDESKAGKGNTIKVTQFSSVKYKKKTKTVNVAWKKNTTGKGYQIQYSTKKTFAKAKTVKIKKNKIVKATVKKLKKGTWYFRIRTVKGKKFSAWSKAKKVTVK